MSKPHFISTETLCSQYNIQISFVDAINELGLIQVEIIEQTQFIHQDQIRDFEKIVRLHKELNVNLEGIDVVFNMLEKERELRNELTNLRNRLSLYENL